MHFFKHLLFTVFPCFPLNSFAPHINDEECLRRSLPSSRCHSQLLTYYFSQKFPLITIPFFVVEIITIEWRLGYCCYFHSEFFSLQNYVTMIVSLKLSYANACCWIAVPRRAYCAEIRELIIRFMWIWTLVRFMFYDLQIFVCWCRYSTSFTSVHGETPSAEYARMRRESLEDKFGHALGTYSSKSFNAVYRFGPFLALYRASIISFHVLRLMICQLFVHDMKKRAVKVTDYILLMLFIHSFRYIWGVNTHYFLFGVIGLIRLIYYYLIKD